ncbi:ParB/Srx family N-terminal domain-containing protein [Thermoactinomyces sp. CICC 10521]|uniref:ParB/Srx family N-terminal domain-containing protein n=1 Tax=Thermoactinomyces sp. CICC 10521 TaxID=2767426 RepID=UPI0018DBC76A|nr:ParB N-terminal domain-containing protein [Thermoactinomyces sp. CICC 10521]MBH8609322.1 ParB N-terminal domain-containing protein [Thermoactinomyces sp. CICC 10521]
MKTEKIKLTELRNPEKNVRIHPKKQIQEMIRSVKMFGQIRPLIVDENNVILAGNGLYEALKEMGVTEADVLRVTHLTDKQKKKLMLADNRVYSLGIDDNKAMLEILGELKDELDIPGFDDDLLKDLLGDLEDTEQQLADYGKLDEAEIEEFQEAAERKEAMMEKAKQQAVEEKQEPPSSPPTESKRTIHCPHCGGRIEL